MPHRFSLREDRGLVAVTIGIVGGIEGYLTAALALGSPLPYLRL